MDITPIPGFSMAGYAVGGTVARGYWTRLFARAIYLDDAKGTGLVLVACDLWVMPAGLSDRVAEIVTTYPEARHLSRGQIVVAATHTHQSPGNYASARLYNDFAQRWAGFDPDLFEHLAQHIARAVLTAVRKRRPAVMFWGETRVDGLMRNRSLEAFLLNPERQHVLLEHAALTGGLAEKAVDPRVTTLRLMGTRGPDDTIAVAAFLAVHPTVMPPDTEVYTSDLFGVATTLVEQRLSRPDPPVVALFNGALGDVQPAAQSRGRREVLRLGRRLATAILDTHARRVPLEGGIQHHFRVVRLAGHCFREPVDAPEGADITRCTASKPLPGVALLGGAEDGRTVFYTLGWQEGVRRAGRRLPRQGAKQPALDPTFLPSRTRTSITRLVVSRAAVPRKAALGVYTLGQGLVLATLPGEFTTVMGWRVADALTHALRPTPERVLLLGLAQEYVSYFATPQEYEAQHYEGASTLYGPSSGPLIAHALHRLATSKPDPTRPYRFSYRPGRVEQFGLRDVGAPPHTPDDGLAPIAQDLETGFPLRALPRFCWSDAVPILPAYYVSFRQACATARM